MEDDVLITHIRQIRVNQGPNTSFAIRLFPASKLLSPAEVFFEWDAPISLSYLKQQFLYLAEIIEKVYFPPKYRGRIPWSLRTPEQKRDWYIKRFKEHPEERETFFKNKKGGEKAFWAKFPPLKQEDKG